MKRLISTYRLLNTISIDVSLGAVISSLFFSKIMCADVRPFAYIALGLTVWIVYTVDHLLDAKRLTTVASTQRHKFHQDYFTLLLLVVVIVLIVDVHAVLSLRRTLFVAGLVLSLAIAFYLLLQHYLSPLKEFFGGILYTAGVTLPALILGHEVDTLPNLVLVTHFLFIVWMNLLLFSLLDKELDKTNDYISFTTKMGDLKTGIAVIILFSLSVLLGIFQIIYSDWYAALILLSMNAILLIVFFKREKFVDGELHRLIGDAVFLLPIFYVIAK